MEICQCRNSNHPWAADDRQRAHCPARIVRKALTALPRHRDFRHVRRDLADLDLWHPLIVNLVVGACSHPAQAAWTVDDLENAIAARLRVVCIDAHLREPKLRRPRKKL